MCSAAPFHEQLPTEVQCFVICGTWGLTPTNVVLSPIQDAAAHPACLDAFSLIAQHLCSRGNTE
jgi:hypothetical protein